MLFSGNNSLKCYQMVQSYSVYSVLHENFGAVKNNIFKTVDRLIVYPRLIYERDCLSFTRAKVSAKNTKKSKTCHLLRTMLFI